MTNEEAKYVLHEIKNIRSYKKIIKSIDLDLQDIDRQIHAVMEPSSTLGNDGPKIEMHKDKASIVNSLFADEDELSSKKRQFEMLLEKAERYYTRLLVVCDPHEKMFVEAFFRGVSYERLTRDYFYENPYKKIILMIKKTDQRLGN